MRGMIFASSRDGIIGVDGAIPWRYPGDFKRFKRVTLGGTVVMGRNTWESIGKPLPGRLNVVVSRSLLSEVVRGNVTLPPPSPAGMSYVSDIDEALRVAPKDGDVWFIGGARIYEAAMAHVHVIDETLVPVDVAGSGEVVRAPQIDERVFEPGPWLNHEDEPALLLRRVWLRRSLTEAPYDLPDNRRLQERGYLTRTKKET